MDSGQWTQREMFKFPATNVSIAHFCQSSGNIQSNIISVHVEIFHGVPFLPYIPDRKNDEKFSHKQKQIEAFLIVHIESKRFVWS